MAWTVTMPISKDSANHYVEVILLLHQEVGRWQVKEIVCIEVEMTGCADDPDWFEGVSQGFSNAPKRYGYTKRSIKPLWRLFVS